MLSKFAGGFILITLVSNSWSAFLQDNGNGSVTDFDTGLVWQQLDDNVLHDWNAAISYCNGLALAGKSDWRLPNIKELSSIVDYRVDRPSIDKVFFPDTKVFSYWSASSDASDNDSAWAVRFERGYTGTGLKIYTDYAYARCVR